MHTGHHDGVGILGTLFLLLALDKLIANYIVDSSGSFVIKKMFNLILAPVQCVYVCVKDGILFIANFAVLSITNNYHHMSPVDYLRRQTWI